MRGLWICMVACVVVFFGRDAAAQLATAATQPPGTIELAPLLPGIDGPPPPVPPAVISRDEPSRATIRAIRLSAPLRIDGRLDEAAYSEFPAISDFIQQDPREGEPATEQTDVWVFFDSDSIYVVGRCWDSRPDRIVGNEMRRDGSRIPSNDQLAFTFDTFRDRRNGYSFELTPLGGRLDKELSNDGVTFNRDWNGVWEAAGSRFESGWIIETRIPFRSLRYREGPNQVWGFQVRRRVIWKNETSYITAIPRSIGGRGHDRVSLHPALVGLEVPPAGLNLEVKPYGISNLSTDTLARPRVSNDVTGDWGGDVKYSITKSLTADFTYNTDFAQVEADQQQVNLTRFSLFFPEKREFFLENAGIFTFGGATGNNNTPALFYSRRIGIDGSRAVPIVAGGRLTGRVGRYNIGLLNIATDDVAATGLRSTDFTVVRLTRDVFRRSSIGAIVTNRSVSQNRMGSSQAYGVDGSFIVTDNLTIDGFWARTENPSSMDDRSYRGNVAYDTDRFAFQFERLAVGADFNPEVGFVRQPNLNRVYGLAQYSPRPRTNRFVRKLYYTATLAYHENEEGRVDTRAGTGEFALDFHNGNRFNVKFTNTYEFLPARLVLRPEVIVPPGGYEYSSVTAGFSFVPRPTFTPGNFSLERGSFYDGTKTTFTAGSTLISLPPHLMMEPTYSANVVDLPQGSFTTHLWGPRVSYNMTPAMFVSALIQYNSTTDTASANVRFRWEYQPGSELFVVWNEQRDTLVPGFPGLQNRALIVKINRLFRF